MPKFHYVAKRGSKEVVEGTLEAEDRSHAFDYLTALGHTPVRITELKPPRERRSAQPSLEGKVPTRALNIFTRQFASLVRSSVPILRVLRILQEQTQHPRLQRIAGEIGQGVQEGQTLSQAMERFPRVFSQLYVNLIRTGEAGGTLDIALDRLAELAEREEALRAKVKAALVYPAFVGVTGALTIVFIMVFVMPRLLKLFVGFGDRIPLPTQILVAVTHWVTRWEFWAVCSIIGLLVFLVWKGLGPRRRVLVDRLSFRVPILRGLIQKLELARFARSFGLLLAQGVPIFQAIEVAIPVVNHELVRKDLGRLTSGLREGSSMADCLKDLPISTSFLVNTVAVGEESGKLEEAFMEIADFYERESERLLRILSALLEPALILGVGCIVGFIVMAVLLPIFEISLH